MKKYIDLNSWNRKEHFQHFHSFDDPFFGLTVDVDFTAVYKRSKAEKSSLFIDIFYEIMRAVNNTEAFRYRIEDDKVVCFDTILASTTVGRADGVYGVCLFDYSADRSEFIKNAKPEVDKVKSSTGLMLTEDMQREDVIHYSSVPWIRFTDMKHPMSFGRKDSVPKISTGKLYQSGDVMMLPVSITASHALMDGFHIAQFLDELNNNIASIAQ